MGDSDIELLTRPEAMAFLRISSTTLSKLTASKELKSVKIKSRRFYKKADLVDYINNQSISGE